MTVELVEMSDEAFARFRERLVTDYARENVIAGRTLPEASEIAAAREVSELLSEGTSTEGQYLYILKEPGEDSEIGSVWVALRDSPSGRMVWVYDLYIEEEYRNRGYGAAALRRIDGLAAELGAENVGLHVFGHNRAAVRLYRRYGYETTSIVMTRRLNRG